MVKKIVAHKTLPFSHFSQSVQYENKKSTKSSIAKKELAKIATFTYSIKSSTIFVMFKNTVALLYAFMPPINFSQSANKH